MSPTVTVIEKNVEPRKRSNNRIRGVNCGHNAPALPLFFVFFRCVRNLFLRRGGLSILRMLFSLLQPVTARTDDILHKY